MTLRPNEYRIGVTRRQEYAELKWVTELPTTIGWYWVYIQDFHDPKPYLVHVEKDHGGYLGISNGDYLESLEDYVSPFASHWLGPLPVPESP